MYILYHRTEAHKMKIYALNNDNNNIGQLIGTIVPWGIFAGRTIDAIFTIARVPYVNNRRVLPAPGSSDVELRLFEITAPEDVVITSSLTNFSIDFVSALQVVSEFDAKGVRVIAFQEDFDSFSDMAQSLLSALPTMHKFRRNAFAARRKNREAGIARAAAEGKYKGRQAYSISDFPNFRNLYDQYMYREISKGEFAEKLGVSRPTLDKLLQEFTASKE